MIERSATANWRGNLTGGEGEVATKSGSFQGNYSFASRFEEGEGTNPEELIAAAHAGCYSMALSHALHEAGYESQRVTTEARVSLNPEGEAPAIEKIHLDARVKIDDIEQSKFLEFARDAKENCPVSKALAGTEITLNVERV